MLSYVQSSVNSLGIDYHYKIARIANSGSELAVPHLRGSFQSSNFNDDRVLGYFQE